MSESTIYLDRTGPEQWELSSRGLCIYCATRCRGECPARWCMSCSQMYLTTFPMSLDEQGPYRSYCPECVSDACDRCGAPASSDIHDEPGAGRHSFVEAA